MKILTKKEKKLLKHLVKKLNEKHSNKDERRNMQNLVNIFVKHNEYGDSGKDFYLFAGTDIKEIIKELDNYINIEGVHFTSAYDCTGRYFSDRIKVKKLIDRTLITQQWYYDV